MTNEQAIKELQESHDIMRNHDIDESESYLMQALGMAIKALQGQADGDLISRQAVIDAIYNNEDRLYIAQAVRAIPTAEPRKIPHFYEVMDSHMYHNKLDAMRAEIAEEIESYRMSDWETNNIMADGLQMALNIIDRYREGEQE